METVELDVGPLTREYIEENNMQILTDGILHYVKESITPENLRYDTMRLVSNDSSHIWYDTKYSVPYKIREEWTRYWPVLEKYLYTLTDRKDFVWTYAYDYGDLCLKLELTLPISLPKKSIWDFVLCRTPTQ
jgi:hypothetical protein